MVVSTPTGDRPVQSSYDVVVVGSGPGGGAAAFYAASGGLSTLLVDRKHFPRSKVCGDGLTPRALRALDRMGLGEIATAYQTIQGVRFVNGTEASVYSYDREQPPFTFGAVVPRIVLDDRIRRAAQAAGAEFAHGAEVSNVSVDSAGYVRGVEVETEGERRLIEAAITIVADGAAGRIGGRLRGDLGRVCQPPGLAVRCYVKGVECLGPYFEFHAPLVWRGRSVLGYSWIFPVASGIANVGLGVVVRQSVFDERRLRMALREFIAELRAHDSRFAHAEETGALEGGPVNTRMTNVFLTPQRALLVGEAAGLVNVFTGEGIAYALESGELAARVARASIRGRVRPNAYYARKLVAAYPRHWALRESPRHLRWVLSIGSSLVESERPPGVIAALQSLVLDHPLTERTGDLVRLEDPRSSTIRRLLKIVRSRAVRRLGRQDRILGEIVDALFSVPGSPVTIPLVVAGVVMGARGLRDTTCLNALTAITLFTLAQYALDAVERIPNEHGQLSDTAAILIGDCITTEGARMLAALPESCYRDVSSAFREVARMHVARSNRALVVSPEAEYAALAAPISCAAAISIQSGSSEDDNSDADDVVPFARWYGATRLAMEDLREASAWRLVAYLRTQLEHADSLDALSRPALRTLASTLCSDLRAILAIKVHGRNQASSL